MNMYMNYGRDGLADCCVVSSFDEIKTLLLLVVVVVVVLVLLLLHMSPKHKNACPYNATKTFRQPLVGQKQKDQNHRLVTNPCTAWHKHIIK